MQLTLDLGLPPTTVADRMPKGPPDRWFLGSDHVTQGRVFRCSQHGLTKMMFSVTRRMHLFRGIPGGVRLVFIV